MNGLLSILKFNGLYYRQFVIFLVTSYYDLTPILYYYYFRQPDAVFSAQVQMVIIQFTFGLLSVYFRFTCGLPSRWVNYGLSMP